VVPQLVNETILNLRRHLVTLKINDLAKSIKEVNNDDEKKRIASRNNRLYDT
jgi:hypothetical protein